MVPLAPFVQCHAPAEMHLPWLAVRASTCVLTQGTRLPITGLQEHRFSVIKTCVQQVRRSMCAACCRGTAAGAQYLVLGLFDVATVAAPQGATHTCNALLVHVA